MLEMAHKFEKNIKGMAGIQNTSTMIFTFKDNSKLKFEMTPKSHAQTTGGKDSIANQFASSVKSFRTFDKGFEFVFKDNSKLSYNLGDAAKSSYDQPKK